MTDINRFLEHTILKQGMTENTVRENFNLCSDLRIPVLVVPPSFVKYASSLKSAQNISICTVIGFPLGYSTFETKIFEIEDAVRNGADEIDLVIDNSLLKENKWKDLNNEFAHYRDTCGEKILKVIVETSLLSRDELEKTAVLLIENKIDYIKTSTGFVGEGAQIGDIILLKENFGDRIKIKASGGIKTKDQALQFIKAGADRIGTSSSKQITEK
jgi:deoxyribose-phosphate aldolase